MNMRYEALKFIIMLRPPDVQKQYEIEWKEEAQLSVRPTKLQKQREKRKNEKSIVKTRLLS